MHPPPQVKFRTLHHYDVLGHSHFLTFSCWHNQRFLSSDRTRNWFLKSLEQARRKHPFDLWAWVIMPDHVHLLLWPHEGTFIGPLLKTIKQSVSKEAVAWVKRNCPQLLGSMLDLQPNGRRCYRFWQPGGGHDRNIYSAKEAREKRHYIHCNPIRKNLVESPVDWRWSSAKAWETGEDAPIRIDRQSFPPLND